MFHNTHYICNILCLQLFRSTTYSMYMMNRYNVYQIQGFTVPILIIRENNQFPAQGVVLPQNRNIYTEKYKSMHTNILHFPYQNCVVKINISTTCILGFSDEIDHMCLLCEHSTIHSVFSASKVPCKNKPTPNASSGFQNVLSLQTFDTHSTFSTSNILSKIN